MTVPGNIDALLLGGQKGYQISRSLRFNSADSAFLSRTPAGAGNRRTFTCSAWVKRTGILASLIDVPLLSAADGTNFGISGTGALGATYDGRFYIRNGGANLCRMPNALFRDPTAWYHIVFVIDTANATAADRQIVYVNGTRQENFDASFTQNTDTNINTATVHTIGVGLVTTANSSYSGNFLLAEYNFIDGQALTPSSFGETDITTGVWKPKRYSGTYGTNGFYLNFSDNSNTTAATLGADRSGNGNNWTPNNFSVTAGAGNDSLVDSPTLYGSDTGAGGEVRGNYCTLNPLDNGGNTVSNGNLVVTTSTGFDLIRSTFVISSGKWYWEVTADDGGEGFIGISSMAEGLNTRGAETTNSATIRTANGDIRTNATNSAYGSTVADGNTMMFALDMDAGKFWAGNNGTWFNSGSPAAGTNAGKTGLTVPVSPSISVYDNEDYTANFGQRPFAYTAPSGFKALCTTNLPEPTLVKGSSYMDVVTYTGTGSALTPTSSLGFSPDLVWIKGRSGATDHALYDTVRGVQAQLESNTTTAETTETTGLTAFNSNGFTVGALAQLNTNAATYASWCWDENVSAGFDIVTYTGNGVSGRAVTHDLGVAPKMVIVKSRTGAYDWSVWHTGIGTTQYMSLNKANAVATLSTVFNGSFTSTQFTVGTFVGVNENSATFVAYLWADVAGYSAFGSYTGNGSTDGPFVFTGFRPKWVMVKRTDTSGFDWEIFDSVRTTFNPIGNRLWANQPTIESSATRVDFLSNGFKLRDSGGQVNGGTIVYAAFAENPFKYSLAR